MAGVFRSLEPSDISITPFQAYKEWNNLSDFSIYTASYGTRSSLNGGVFVDTFDLGNPGILGAEPTTSGGYYQRVVWNSIDHIFYRDYYKNPYRTFSNPDISLQTRDLRQKAQIVGISADKVGEGILKDSVRLTISGAHGIFDLYDDQYGNLNLAANDQYTSSLISFDDQLTHWQFYDLHKYIDIGSGGVTYTRDYYKGDFPYTFNLTNVVPSEATYVTYPNLNTGSAAYFTASLSSSIEVVPLGQNEQLEYLNFRQKDFGISLMVYAASDNVAPTSSILTKNGRYRYLGYTQDGQTQEFANTDRFRYPYQIQMMSSSAGFNIQADRSTGGSTVSVTSSVLSADAWHHVLYTKSGSTVKLYVDGTAQQTATDITDTALDQPINNSYVYIGSIGGDSGYFTGGVSEVLFIEKTPTTAQISTLAALSGSNTTSVGNAFYEHGMIAITDPKYADYSVTAARVRGTHTIYEYQVICTSPAGECNLSMNPTLTEYDPTTRTKKVRGMFTESYFNPYVTSIGLYDDFGNLLVAAKLPQPVEKLDNIDMTYVIKFDR